ncbi:nicotinamide-nucleotide amidohydrolase family protein [Pseudodesulfovibrio cashew]|uniref:Nicotinamide-nucleotide amidohydrolase family protein n=1 Tax=Pseudodesulfovibrio cashew TaxID=2678688 RepID=A0A6I6JFK4_9BACT|nr:CinA family protein [Pseudodesulfovibrio cashew]QGY39959.1 nicotinamide-nucleotide amidohydrolase family protein [Pseudodesulfovibrio cashew]
MDTNLISRAIAELGECLRAHGNMLATAESCTGGLLSSTLTDVPGSSEWFAGGIVAYAYEVKTKLLGVPKEMLEEHGAVSEPVVRAMAETVLKTVGADVSVAISGIAGPGGGTPDKPVGTVWMAWAWAGGVRAKCYTFSGDRASVKGQSVMAAVNGLLSVAR